MKRIENPGEKPRAPTQWHYTDDCTETVPHAVVVRCPSPTGSQGPVSMTSSSSSSSPPPPPPPSPSSVDRLINTVSDLLGIPKKNHHKQHSYNVTLPSMNTVLQPPPPPPPPSPSTFNNDLSMGRFVLVNNSQGDETADDQGTVEARDRGTAVARDQGIVVTRDQGIMVARDRDIAKATDQGIAKATDQDIKKATDEDIAKATDQGMVAAGDQGIAVNGNHGSSAVGDHDDRDGAAAGDTNAPVPESAVFDNVNVMTAVINSTPVNEQSAQLPPPQQFQDGGAANNVNDVSCAEECFYLCLSNCGCSIQ